jgi:ATP-binding cassette subfamily B protein
MKNFITLKEDFLKYKWRFISGFLFLLIVDVLQLFIPRVIKHAIDDLVTGSGIHLLGYGFIILGIAGTIALFRFFWRYFITGTARRIERNLRNRLFLHFEQMGARFYAERKTGDLMAHCTNDIDAVRRSIGMGTIGITDIIVLGSMSIVFMLLINFRLTLYAIAPLPVLTFIVLKFSRLIHIRFKRVQESFATITSDVQENIAGIRVIRGYNQEKGEIKKFKGLARDYVDKNISLVKVWGLFEPLVFLLANLSMVLILWLGGGKVILQEITMGDFVAFTSYLGILIWPMIAIGWVINILQRGAASMGRINKLLDTKPEIRDTGDRRIKTIKGMIEFKNLSFSYNGSPVLKKINLAILPGNKLGITGSVGSGKTTLVDLIARVHQTRDGGLLVDGRDIKEIPLNVLRSNIGFVPQDTFLFQGSIQENIAFGRSDIGFEEIKRVSKITEIYDEIMDLPNGFDTIIGERGITLSGGQRQRLAIARAIIIDPKIFILDDALSSVDMEKEVRILKNLESVIKGRTSIVISHRIRGIMDSNEIIVLKDGEISERGTHKELLNRNGFYFKLWRMQQIEREIE